MRLHSFFFLIGLGLGACTTQTANPTQFVLNGPSDVAFACVGNTAVPDGGVSEIRSFPTASCGRDPSRDPPECSNTDAGPGDAGPPRPGVPTTPSQVYFIPEKASGTLKVAQFGGSTSSFVDQDPFTPGVNGVAVGRLPVAAGVSSDGCWVVVANSGSCDLAVVDVIRASAARPDPVRVRSAVAGLERSRPAEMVQLPSIPYNTTPLPTCESPAGTAFVAYPSCHLVARVDLATFQMLDGIQFKAGTAPAIVGPEFDFSQCPSECEPRGGRAGTPADGDGGLEAADAGLEPEPETKPATLAIEPDGSRLYIGTSDSGNLISVALDATGKPTGVAATPLEGVSGIRKVAPTGEVRTGKEGASLPFHYVYAIGDDQAIHVVDVSPERQPGECDTQLDRRFLRSIGSTPRLACLRVGDPTNPPRRPEAVGPAIRLPAGVLPIDVGFAQSFGCPTSPPQPDVLRGYFAVVAALGPTQQPPRGVAYFINVVDWTFDSTQRTFTDRTVPDLAFGYPHALRDTTLGRWTAPLATCQEENLPDDFGAYRITPGFPDVINEDIPTNTTFEPGDELQPGLRRVKAEALIDDPLSGNFPDSCANSNLIVSELSSIAPMKDRTELWTDATLVGRLEQLNVVFEGALAPEDARSRRTGGAVSVQAGEQMRLDANGANLCGLGPQPGDIVRLLGCASIGDCATDETCYVHPAAPLGVAGMCVPKDKILEYSADCLGILISARRYTAIETADDHVRFITRPRTLPETPLEGCTASPEPETGDQCVAIEEAVLARREVANAELPGTRPRHTFRCRPVPEIGPGNRCVETCTTQSDCEDGTFCHGGECVLGPVPDPKCVSPLQRYELRAGDSFTVVSSINGYRHREVRRADGQCVLDPTRSPLLAARIRRDAPPCTDTSVTSLEPNPCTLVGVMEPYLDANDKRQERPTHAIRLRTPGLTFDVVDISQPLTVMVNGQSQTVNYSPAQFGAGYQIQIAGGFFPFIETAIQANLPIRIRKGVEGALYVVDGGDQGSTGGTRGQVISIVGNASSTAVAPIRLF